MGLGVRVQDDARIQKGQRVEDALYVLHEPVRVLPPLHLDEGRHVAARAVLGLEGAVVLLDDHHRHVVHELAVALDLFGVSEILGEDEVQVPLQRVAEDDGFGVAVFFQEALQLQGRVGQALDGEGHVLDDDRGAGGPHRADGREEAFADVPQLGEFLRHGGELDLADHFHSGQSGLDGLDLGVEPGLVLGPGLDQQGRGGIAQFAQVGRHAVLVLH